jgi:hypothetical protein
MNTLDEFIEQVRLADADLEFFRYKCELTSYVSRCCREFEHPDKIILTLTDYFHIPPIESEAILSKIMRAWRHG